MTHRQYVVWQAWLDMQWEIPSRSDHYLMRIAFEACRANQRIKRPNKVKIDDFRVKFTRKDDKRKVSIVEHRTPEEEQAARDKAAAMSKGRWAMALAAKFPGFDPAKMKTVKRKPK